MITRRLSAALAILLLASCAPTGLPAAAPAVTVPAAVERPAAQPGADSLPTPPVRLQYQAQVTFPTGSVELLRTTMRIQDAVDSAVLTAADLAKLVVIIDGKVIPASQFTVASLQWDSAGGIRAELVFNGEPPPQGTRISVSLPSQRLVLLATVGPTAIAVSVASTARTLLEDAAAKAGKPAAVTPEAVTKLAELLANRMTTASTGDPLTSPDVINAIQNLLSANANNVPVSSLRVGGGGGGGGAPVVPALTSITPSSGAIGTTPVLTITGTNFLAGAIVTIGGVAATAVSVDSVTQITATVPAGLAVGPHTLTVTAANAQFVSQSPGYTVFTPTATGVSPAWGATGTTPVLTITGTNFVAGATVTVNGVAATGISVDSATQITATVPAGLATGLYDAVVTNPGGGGATVTNAYRAAVPTFTSVTPTVGDRRAGVAITITGTYFAAGASVTVGGVAATGVTVVSATQITATVPASNSPGAKDIVITNPGGSSVTGTGAFTVTGADTGVTANVQNGLAFSGTPTGGNGL